MEFSQEERDFLIKLLNQLTFNVESLDQGVLVKTILDKLGQVSTEVDKEVKE